MDTRSFALAVTLCAAMFGTCRPAGACTGITLKSAGDTTIVARTIEWGGSYLNSQYVIVPRGYAQQSMTPDGAGGMKFVSRYGYVGLSVEQKDFVAEGLNEEGLSAGLFYFPGYGKYADYDSARKEHSVTDLQLLSWLLGQCATIDDVKAAIDTVTVIGIDPRASTVHWRFAEPSGRQAVLEFIGGQPRFYDNPLGVLTNSPGFEWQLTNLNNYVNLFPGSAPDRSMGGVGLSAFGAGSGALGLPGDVTPPSRFVRAAFYQTTAPTQPDARSTVLQCFQILNNFDIPVGVEFPLGQVPSDIPSATQWTSATDMCHRILYFRTMYDSTIRCIDLNTVDFASVSYRAVPLDPDRRQKIETVKLD